MDRSRQASPCTLCNGLQKKNSSDARLGIDFTASELQSSANDGRCSACLILLEAIRQSPNISLQEMARDVRRIYARCHETRALHRGTLTLEVYFNDDRPKVLLEVYSVDQHGWKGILPRSRVSGNPESRAAIRWVKSLMDECLSTHEVCRTGHQPRLPKRVLSIGTDRTIQLCEPAQGSSASYAALSHCWGHHQSCTTTRASHKDRLMGIGWSSIPKTFQDAIKMTSLLGIKYIWIDSLCIIQDDIEDWNTESANMAAIYQDASVTLSATASSGDMYGCYDASSKGPHDVRIALPSVLKDVKIAVRKPVTHWTDPNPGVFFPLTRRGWAYQERLLSCRILHFAGSELVWECRGLVTCECNGLSQHSSLGGEFYQTLGEGELEKQGEAEKRSLLIQTLELRQAQEDVITQRWKIHALDAYARTLECEPRPGSKLRSLFRRSAGRKPVRSGSDDKIPAWVQSYINWEWHRSEHNAYELELDVTNMRECANFVFHFHRIIETYSALELTKRSDRLPALSGVCSRLQHLRGAYAAGLWHDSLCFDLMWRVDSLRSDTPEERSDVLYYGPSWSWISVNCGVRYWTDIFNFFDAGRLLGPFSWHTESNNAALDTGVSLTKPFKRTTCFARSPQAAVSVDISLAGSNPFGNLKSASLSGTASMATATLHYVYQTLEQGSTESLDVDLTRYTLTIEAGFDNEEAIEMPFWADYTLAADGPRNVPDLTKVTLLLIHPQVSLVLLLQEKRHFRRIGIARLSELRVRYYGSDWMRDSEVRDFTIV